MSESLWDSDDVAPAKRNFHAAKRQAVQPAPVTTPPAFTKREAPRDYAFEEAIRNLAPILHADELEQFDSILHPEREPQLAGQIREWRKRNGIL